eukprot:Hpha_TRINITY_DN15194_c0_g6::TRINITY_DN15194_c0_g6_i2::g.126753::m.126753
MRAAALLLLALGASGDEMASSVCVYNGGAFALHWHLLDADTGAKSGETSTYPVGQVKCLSADALTGADKAGHKLVPQVHAVLGGDWTAPAGSQVVYNTSAVGSVTYTCTGTTFKWACKPGPAPPTAANVSVAVGQFLLGFVAAVGEDIGFKGCIQDINATFHDIVNTADFFEHGVTNKSPDTIAKGFVVVGKMLIDFGKAILQCSAEGSAVAAKFTKLGTQVSADPLSVIEVIVKELISVLAHKDDITSDVKSLPVDWHAGDWQGAGHDVGDIVGVLIAGLE